MTARSPGGELIDSLGEQPFCGGIPERPHRGRGPVLVREAVVDSGALLLVGELAVRAVVWPEAVLDVVRVPVAHRLPTRMPKLAAHRRNALAALDAELDRPLPLFESASDENPQT